MKEANIIFYRSEKGDFKVEVWYDDNTFWMSQKRMAALFGVSVKTVSEHLQNIFKSAELAKESVIRNFRITADDGKPYLTQVYHLDAIIAVGYRVNSYEAPQFRIWATQKEGKTDHLVYFHEVITTISWMNMKGFKSSFYSNYSNFSNTSKRDFANTEFNSIHIRTLHNDHLVDLHEMISTTSSISMK